MIGKVNNLASYSSLYSAGAATQVAKRQVFTSGSLAVPNTPQQIGAAVKDRDRLKSLMGDAAPASTRSARR